MKTLVYDTPFDNAEELIGRIALAAGEIRGMSGVYPECSDFLAPEMSGVHCIRWKKLQTLTLIHVPFAFLHLLLKKFFTNGLLSLCASVHINWLRKAFLTPTLLYDFESSGCTIRLLGVLKPITERPCM